MTSSRSVAPAIRPGMDVFSAYQNQYIGTVIAIMHRVGDDSGRRGSEGNPAGNEQTSRSAPLVHVEGNPAVHLENESKRHLGEGMGPVPTARFGNTGPLNQSASRAYATNPSEVVEELPYFVVRPGRLNLGPVSRPLYIPGSAVHSISMERIVLGVQREEMPAEWDRRPETRSGY